MNELSNLFLLLFVVHMLQLCQLMLSSSIMLSITSSWCFLHMLQLGNLDLLMAFLMGHLLSSLQFYINAWCWLLLWLWNGLWYCLFQLEGLLLLWFRLWRFRLLDFAFESRPIHQSGQSVRVLGLSFPFMNRCHHAWDKT
jgi:hypothetical protein